jgi:antitoxin YefM
MRVVNFTDARNNLRSILDAVSNDADYTVITRRDADDAVIMSLDMFNSWMETLHLLSSPKNAKHLEKSINQLKSRKLVNKDIINE